MLQSHLTIKIKHELLYVTIHECLWKLIIIFPVAGSCICVCDLLSDRRQKPCCVDRKYVNYGGNKSWQIPGYINKNHYTRILLL